MWFCFQTYKVVIQKVFTSEQHYEVLKAVLKSHRNCFHLNFTMKVVVSAIETASGDEGFTIDIKANTRGAATTWKTNGASLCLGTAAVTGRADSDSTGTYWFAFHNPEDYQIAVFGIFKVEI